MSRVRESLLVVTTLLFSSPALGQNEPIVLEAESAARGSAFNLGEQDGTQYISIATTIGGGNPTSDARIATFNVTFPGAGAYELYARLRVGPATFDDDSFYYANGFGAKVATADADWILANGLASAVGFTLPTDIVVGGGMAQSNVWKWMKLSAFDGGEQPVGTFTVAADALTQTFQIAGRENGLDIDKIAFGRQGVFFTVNDLDNRLPGTTVPPPPPYTPPGPPIATGQEKFLGSAFAPSHGANFAAYWNKVTPENAGKWGSVEGTRDVMNWAPLDQAYQLAQTNGFPFHMHVLIWGAQQPAWMETLPPAEQLAEIQEWFAEVAARYPNLDFVEVVNEPLHQPPDQPGRGNYIAALGGSGTSGWDWILNAFRMARSYFPNSKLMINDYSITNTPNDTQRYLQIIALLQAESLIDAIGVQGHAFSTRPNIPMSTHVANLDALTATGLPIYVTELDVDGPTDAVQLQDYQRIFPVFWEHPGVKGITMWGYRPGMWRTAQGAYLVLDNGAERPAMKWLQRYVANALPVVTSGQTFTISETIGNGQHVGTVAATDADADTTLSLWQVDGGDGAAAFAIDAATGAISIVDAAALDFETKTSYQLEVSVYDGYRRSASGTVTIQLDNANDNAPVIAAGQQFRIDAGARNVIAAVVASDPDDGNEPGFTTLQNWRLSGNGAAAFAIDPSSGVLKIARPEAIDFRRSSYTLTASVSDGLNTAAPQSVRIAIPSKLNMCLWFVEVQVPKLTAPLLVQLGASFGQCRAQ